MGLEYIIIICLSVALIAALIIQAIIIYQQMLLVNEVNKRLMLIADNAVTQEQNTQDELDRRVQEMNDLVQYRTGTNDNNELRDEDLDL